MPESQASTSHPEQVDDFRRRFHTGIIHRDVKPGSILVSDSNRPADPPRIRLTDFGIGQVASRETLAGVTRAGFTQTLLAGTSATRTGTHLVSGSKDGTIRLWNLSKPRRPPVQQVLDSGVHWLAISPLGSRIPGRRKDGKGVLQGEYHHIHCAAFQRDGRRLWLGTRNRPRNRAQASRCSPGGRLSPNTCASPPVSRSPPSRTRAACAAPTPAISSHASTRPRTPSSMSR